MLIREMRAEDVPAVESIQRACAGQAAQWDPGDYLRLRSLVVVAEGQVRGFLVWRETVAGEEAEILNLAVEERFRHEGLASALLQQARTEWKGRVWLEVRASNGAARRFYERQGFQPAGVRHGYYSGPDEDGIVMCL